jgi:NAD(P)H-hydrate epimerase
MTTSPSSLNEIYERSIIEGMTLGLDDHGHGYLSAEHFNSIMEKMAWADAVVLGPGLGREKETQQLIKKLVQTIQKPLVLDADGLFPFSGNIGELNQRRSPLVITPHLGELANLSGIEKENIVSDFPNIMEKFMADFNHVALVKQVPSCTFFDNRAIVNSSGNPGLATGGTGDVLSGMIASLIAQGITPFDAASLGTFIHGKTSDQLVIEKGYRGQIASDLIEKIPGVIAQYENA